MDDEDEEEDKEEEEEEEDDVDDFGDDEVAECPTGAACIFRHFQLKRDRNGMLAERVLLNTLNTKLLRADRFKTGMSSGISTCTS